MVIPEWILLAVFAGLFSNINGFLNRFILLRDNDATAYAWFYQTVRFLFFGSLIFIDPGITLSSKFTFFLIALGFLEFFSTILYMRMFLYAQLSVSTIIYRSRVFLVPIIAFIFLGEVLGIYQYVGILLLFMGLSTVSSPHKIKMDKGIKYSYLSAITVSGLTTLMKEVSSFASTPVLASAMSLPSVILIPIFMKSTKTRILSTFKNEISLKLLACVANILALYLQFMALKAGPVGQVNAIYQSMMIVSVVLGITVLKEREDMKKKILGSIVALIGAILVSL